MAENSVLIQRVVDHIETEIERFQSESLSVLSLADACGLSPWHFQRLFKTLVGDTLGGYLRGRRLAHAAHMLLTSDTSILDIALQVGFNSHEALTRSFKAQYHVSPKQFRLQKPQVLQQHKPLLNPTLFHHLDQELDQQPRIVVRPRQLLMGFSTRIPSPFMSEGSYCHLLENSWMQLFTQQAQLPKHLAQTYLGLTISDSGNFDETELEYLAAVVLDTEPEQDLEAFIKDNEGLVPELKFHILPEQRIAVFDVANVEIDTVGKTMDYIYGYWLPNADYQRSSGDDYELFEGVTSMDFSDIQASYVIPVDDK